MNRLIKYEWIVAIIGLMAIVSIAVVPRILFKNYNVQGSTYVYNSTGATNPASAKQPVNGADSVVDINIDTIGTGTSSINARIMRAGLDEDFAPIMDLEFTYAPVRVIVPVLEPSYYLAVGLATAQAYTVSTKNKATVKLDVYSPK